MPSFKFHFKEIDLVLYIPSHGNEGREPEKYGVTYRDRKKGTSQPGRSISLKETLNNSAIKLKWPHTVGFFLASNGKGDTWNPDYLRSKKLKTENAFYKFIKDLGL